MKLTYKRTFLVGFAFLSISAFWQLYDTIIPLILRDTYHMGDGPAGIIMSLDNLVALFLLPLFGAISDKTNTKLGRRTPFIIAGTLAASFVMAGAVFNFAVPAKIKESPDCFCNSTLTGTFS